MTLMKMMNADNAKVPFSFISADQRYLRYQR